MQIGFLNNKFCSLCYLEVFLGFGFVVQELKHFIKLQIASAAGVVFVEFGRSDFSKIFDLPLVRKSEYFDCLRQACEFHAPSAVDKSERSFDNFNARIIFTLENANLITRSKLAGETSLILIGSSGPLLASEKFPHSIASNTGLAMVRINLWHRNS